MDSGLSLTLNRNAAGRLIPQHDENFMRQSPAGEQDEPNLILIDTTEDIRMKTIATIAVAALLAGTGSYAFAQQTPAPNAPAASQDRGQPERRGPSQDEFNRLIDARIAAIEAGLKLTSDQEKLWTPVENAIRTSASERFSRFEQFSANRDQRQSMDFMQRLERRSTMMTEGAQRSATVTTALRPLWDTFSEDQKRIAPRLLREVVDMGGPGRPERGDRRGHGREHGRMGVMMDHGRRGMMMGHGGPQGPQQQ
jgi:LTXXQ motif family protein